MYDMRLEDHVLRELHRAALEAGRRGISVPSADLDAVARHTGSREAAQKAIQRLVRAQRVVPVRKDLLVLPDTTGLLGVDMADLVDAIAPQPYLITGGRALERHGLSDQHFFGVIVLVPSPVKKLSYRGQTATFLLTNPTNIWGWQEGVRPQYALGERAIVDALNHPRYAVSLTQALDAMLLAASKDPEFMDRLLETVIRSGSPSAGRRVGLVVERFFGTGAAAPYRGLIGENRAPVLMRPRGTRDGPLDTTWRVVVNAILEPERTLA
jgi:predicted transcriptional regulator of viral defense system